MKKWLLCGATLLMLSPTAAYAQQEETKSVINPVVANSTVTTWEQFTKELIKKINSFETDINITYTGPMGDFKKRLWLLLIKLKSRLYTQADIWKAQQFPQIL